MTCSKTSYLRTLTLAFGANLPSKTGSPITTLIKVRPDVENLFHEWLKSFPEKESIIYKTDDLIRFRWSPLFETNAIGGPKNQPNFINAALVVDGGFFSSLIPSEKMAIQLLEKLLGLEKKFGRERNPESIHWGPRTLDIDILAWGELQIKTKQLTLPHPRLTERNFVLTPLAAALNKSQGIPRQISPQNNWKE